MLKNRNYFLILSIIISISVLFTPFISKAITAEGVGVSPAYPNPDIKNSDVWFIYNLDRTESITDYLKLVNISPEKTMIVKLYPVDAVVTSKGVFNPLAETDPKKDIGAWIEMSESEVLLAPEETKIIPFIITIPQDASVGDHIGAIIAEKGELKPSGQPGLSIKTRVGIRVWNTVPGDIVENIQISNISWEIKNKKLNQKATTAEKIKTILGLNKEGFITLELKNEGNVHLMPMANIEITDIFNGWVATLDSVSLGTSPFDKTTTVPVKWTEPSIFGRLTANITILYGDDQSTTAKKSFWIIPWTIFFIIVLLVIIFIFGKLFWRLYYAKSKLKMSEYKVTGRQALNEIADRFNINWKKLARINNLKPPYALKKGDIIFIPKEKAKKFPELKLTSKNKPIRKKRKKTIKNVKISKNKK